MIIGTSNGAIPAVHFAHYYGKEIVDHLYLIGGVRATSQLHLLGEFHTMPPTTLSYGFKDGYFGGSSSFYEAAAIAMGTVFSHEGGHCQEPMALVKIIAHYIANYAATVACKKDRAEWDSPTSSSSSGSSSSGSSS